MEFCSGLISARICLWWYYSPETQLSALSSKDGGQSPVFLLWIIYFLLYLALTEYDQPFGFTTDKNSGSQTANNVKGFMSWFIPDVE